MTFVSYCIHHPEPFIGRCAYRGVVSLITSGMIIDQPNDQNHCTGSKADDKNEKQTEKWKNHD
ncbi:MAG: hypothetical protein A3D31_10840 [Candidatus Fluviicola riflensis]|nr:MAG: hypothetical protein CHH17_15260 [Candidatus Fluviicola riflensis]OGS77491.1 MAG: hypothetical protein A3D31_10840 [Candidatus Fluviicola riflensis]OGS84071.1 MAG: hypothetical protein A3E30_12240 [Fluviicola sp. RIFCSPHIGHO2_12_FULL_43_24]